MTPIESRLKIFNGRKANIEKLLLFGFKKKGNSYYYSIDLLDGRFQLTVSTTRDGGVSAKVVKMESNENSTINDRKKTSSPSIEDYLDEYEDVLDGINDACFEYEGFQSKMAKKAIRYIEEQYQDELEFLWKRFPNNAIVRRKDVGKWYAAFLTVERKKLKLPGEGTIEIIDLKAAPDVVPSLIDGQKYFPGYHMNKRSWITICLDGSVPLKEICRRIDDSFVLAKK